MKSPFCFNLLRILSIAFFSIFLLANCGVKKYIDVSHEAKYKKILGSEYVTIVDLKAIGVTFDANYKKQVDYVYIVKKPGFSGPEVVFSEILKKDSKIVIDGVFASGHMFLNDTYYKIKILDSAKYDNDIVLIYDTGDIESENMGMDEAVFKQVTNK